MGFPDSILKPGGKALRPGPDKFNILKLRGVREQLGHTYHRWLWLESRAAGNRSASLRESVTDELDS